uniref:Uncharacterized protein n=1 Tax=Plectus sambesii TaxID=2011161 RepID=A0A914W8P2_9BILA
MARLRRPLRSAGRVGALFCEKWRKKPNADASNVGSLRQSTGTKCLRAPRWSSSGRGREARADEAANPSKKADRPSSSSVRRQSFSLARVAQSGHSASALALLGVVVEVGHERDGCAARARALSIVFANAEPRRSAGGCSGSTTGSCFQRRNGDSWRLRGAGSSFLWRLGNAVFRLKIAPPLLIINMPANLLGLMVIGMFYVITVVIGLCANRCLSREEDDEPNEGANEDHRYDDLGLLKLLESSLNRPYTAQPASPNTVTFAPSVGPSRSPIRKPSALKPYRPEPVLKPIAENDLVVVAGTAERSPIKRQDAVTINEEVTVIDGRRPVGKQRWTVANSKQMSEEPPIRPYEPPAGIVETRWEDDSSDSLPPPLPPGGRYMLAERNIGAVLGSLSLLAIKTGGVFPNSIAQEVYEQGLIWCQVPIASCISLLLANALFSRHLYTEGHITIVDPFQTLYGAHFGALLFLPILVADLTFVCVILSSLGALLQNALGFSQSIGVVCSVAAILLYLMAGGLYAGTFTDGAQFIYLCLGLFTLFPFIMQQSAVQPLLSNFSKWNGSVNGRNSGIYIDQFSMLILGGIPMQSYFMRVLSSKSLKVARTVTTVTGIGCLINAVPAVIIGAAASVTVWSNTTFGSAPEGDNVSVVLPICLSHLAPKAIMFTSLGALGSGLLASGDSAIFGTSAMLTQNIFRNILRPSASDRELTWFARLGVILICGISMTLCLVWEGWHRHWLLPYDILYVFVFPQLFCCIYFKYSNCIGSLSGLLAGGLLRFGFGEHTLNFPAVLPLPFYTLKDGQLFPYRTLAMFANLITLIGVSLLTHYLWRCRTLCCCCRDRRTRHKQTTSMSFLVDGNRPQSTDEGGGSVAVHEYFQPRQSPSVGQLTTEL